MVVAKIEVEKQLQCIWQKLLLNIQKDRYSSLFSEHPSLSWDLILEPGMWLLGRKIGKTATMQTDLQQFCFSSVCSSLKHRTVKSDNKNLEQSI